MERRSIFRSIDDLEARYAVENKKNVQNLLDAFEDFEITELLGDVIQVVYADTAEDGRSLIRNGIILPEEVVDNTELGASLLE